MGRVADKLPELRPGDDCETLSVLPVRQTDVTWSDIITDLPFGTNFKVLQLSSQTQKRVKVSAGATVGWITTATFNGEALVRRLKHPVQDPDENFVIGQLHEATSLLVAREGESVDSPIVTEIEPGTVVRILEFSTGHLHRARVATDRHDGWVSLVTRRGQVLLGRLSDPLRQGATTAGTGDAKEEACGSPPASKSLLEVARSGDEKSLRRLVEDAPLGHINLNAGDIRGRTALMYAAAFDNEAVVAYLLSQSDVQVNATDDTAKTALHHAAKRTPKIVSPQPVDDKSSRIAMVHHLVRCGSQIEARDHNGCTPLMFAVASGDVGVARVLLRCRAKHNAKDYEGNNAMDYARSLKNQDMMLLLTSFGAEASDTPVRLGNESARNKAYQVAGIRRMISGQVTMKEEVISVEDTGAADRARSKLNVMMKLSADGGAQEPAEIEQAMKDAVDAGVQDDDLMGRAEARIEQLKVTMKAQRDLFLAIEEQSVKALRDAIAVAVERGVVQADIDAAKNALSEASIREEAEKRLLDAQDRGDADSLRNAIDAARKANVAKEVITNAEVLLRAAESRSRVMEALEEAIASKNISALRFGVKQATEAKADPELIERAHEMLRVEVPKQEARAAIAEAVVAQTSAGLRLAISGAREKGVDESEMVEAVALLEKCEARDEAVLEVQAALDASQEILATAAGDIDALREMKEVLTVATQKAKQAGVSEENLREAEGRRRKIHNLIEDIKGSIRVFCRVRPLSSKEKGDNDVDVLSKTDSMTLAMSMQGEKSMVFQFDAVFMPGTQDEVFEDCKDLVQSAFDGYNVTMFAYGQTGAGKTFTMYGAKGAEGTAPRTIREIYNIIERDRERFNYTVMASMMELARNDLVDLLTKTSRGTSPSRRTIAMDSILPSKLNLRMDKGGGVFIENLTEEECKDADELIGLLERGNLMRSVASTAMNSESSRSHLIVMIRIVSVNLETREQIKGKILLCDLAGSERLKKSEVTGEMMKDTIEINKSLTALGDVIEALTKGKGQIPYRNHKLTQVMQDALGGSSKTLMFVNCSPAGSNFDETVMSLKYATRAKRIVNDARKSVKVVGGERGSVFAGKA